MRKMSKKVWALILSVSVLVCLGLSFSGASAAYQLGVGYSGSGIMIDIRNPSHGIINVREGGSSGGLLIDGDIIPSGTTVWVEASADRGWKVDGIEIAGRFERGDTSSATLNGSGVCEISASFYRDSRYDDDDDDDDDYYYDRYGRRRYYDDDDYYYDRYGRRHYYRDEDDPDYRYEQNWRSAERGTVTSVNPSDSMARTATAAAISKANRSGDDQAKVIFRDSSQISQSALRAVSKEADGENVMIVADTMEKGLIKARLYLDPNKAESFSTIIKPGVQTNSDECKKVQANFKKSKGVKNLAVIRFNQQGSFGTTVSAAVNVNLTGFDTSALNFYAYDSDTNTYKKVKLKYSIDKNGYLHFGIEDGRYLIVTDEIL